jgi:DNA excision repair protein ERCC-1
MQTLLSDDVRPLILSEQSFANIAKATPEQLQSLPGFGQVKVKRIKDAFEKPFRPNVTSSVASASEVSAQPSSGSKGKEKADSVPARSSPVWDIELDLDSPTAESGPLPESSAPASAKKRPPSREWDIELDLD